MTALTEIKAAIQRAEPLREGRQRAVLVGSPALTAIYADQRSLRDHPGPKIDGVPIVITTEFQGWALVDVDAEGRRYDVLPV